MKLRLSYEEYLDKVYGGWLGKCIGGTIGARFEGDKNWIDLAPENFFPATIPANDDLDLQLVWLRVLEEKGSALTSADLAQAWLRDCWYPFNEYGMFRYNWRLGIRPPYSGAFGNPFWCTGMGCPIRSEIWGYVFPGQPERAARFARMDGTLDHTDQSVGAEEMFSAMAADAFFCHDLRGLIAKHFHYLPAQSPVARLAQMALEAYDRGLPLPELRARILANAPCAEGCDAQINVPFTIAGLLYGEGDWNLTLQRTLALGYDTDCTLATAAAFLGQIAGAAGVPQELRRPVGDELVMGIEYRRPDMTISGLARDTVRVGTHLTCEAAGVEITHAPQMTPLPENPVASWEIVAAYPEALAAAPGDTVRVELQRCGATEGPMAFTVDAPAGWEVVPARGMFREGAETVTLYAHLAEDIPALAVRNLFTVKAGGREFSFGIKGAELWRMLGVFFDTVSQQELPPFRSGRRMASNFLYPGKEYLPVTADGREAFRACSRRLGRAAMAASRELLVEYADLVALQAEHALYLEREIIGPQEEEVWLSFGHDRPLTVWLNGTLLGQETEPATWSPNASFWRGRLNKGSNVLRVRLDSLGGVERFSCQIRQIPARTPEPWVLGCDLHTGLADGNPLCQL